MSSYIDLLVPTGVYSLTNVASGKRLSLPKGQDSLQGTAPSNDLSDKWIVTLLASKKSYIRNGRSGLYAYPKRGYGEGDSIYAQPDYYEWVIKAAVRSPGSYQIYDRDTNLFWSLSSSSTVELSRDGSSNSSLWTLKKEKDIPTYGALPTVIDDVTRPARKIQNNNFEVTVPQGWTAVVSGFPLDSAINSIYLQSVDAQKFVETVQFYNKYNDENFTLRDSDKSAYQISAYDGPVAIGLTFYCTTDASKKDPLTLAYTTDNNARLKVKIADRPLELRKFTDYRTFHILSSSPSSKLPCATITITLSRNSIKLHPNRLNEFTVNPDYNPECDKSRPQYIDDYLRKYDTLFLVEDSSSMAGTLWDEARNALVDISNEALQHNTDGIYLRFINSYREGNKIQGKNMALGIFDTVTPFGDTPLGARIDEFLGQYIRKLDNAIGTPLYRDIKPLDIICLTIGAPSDDPLPVLEVLEAFAAHLDTMKHHPDIVNVVFVQMGNTPGCSEALYELVLGNVRGMVDRIPFLGPVTPEKIVRIIMGTNKPSQRTHFNQQVPSSPISDYQDFRS